MLWFFGHLQKHFNNRVSLHENHGCCDTNVFFVSWSKCHDVICVDLDCVILTSSSFVVYVDMTLKLFIASQGET